MYRLGVPWREAHHAGQRVGDRTQDPPVQGLVGEPAYGLLQPRPVTKQQRVPGRVREHPEADLRGNHPVQGRENPAEVLERRPELAGRGQLKGDNQAMTDPVGGGANLLGQRSQAGQRRLRLGIAGMELGYREGAKGPGLEPPVACGLGQGQGLA
jgi:hypothetical protein